MSDPPPPPAPGHDITTEHEPSSPAGETPGGTSKRDLVLVHGRTDDGAFKVLRSRDDRLEIGEMRAPKEGQPLMGELVQLHPTEDHEQLFECETLVDAPVRTGAGPPKVANDAYRSGWEQIFGGSGEDEPPTLN